MKSKMRVSPVTMRVGRLPAKAEAFFTCRTLRSWLRVIRQPGCTPARQVGGDTCSGWQRVGAGQLSTRRTAAILASSNLRSTSHMAGGQAHCPRRHVHHDEPLRMALMVVAPW